MFNKKLKKEEISKDSIELEVEAIMGPPPGKLESSNQSKQTDYAQPKLVETLNGQIEAKNNPELPKSHKYIADSTKDLLDNPETNMVIKEIITKESDELLAVKDLNAKLALKPAKNINGPKTLLIVIVLIIVLVFVALILFSESATSLL
jgi:hypothetical protein